MATPMQDSLLSRRRIKLKFLVSFNGAFRRLPPQRKLRYVGGENRIISLERDTSFQILKSKIAHFICPSVNSGEFGLKYHVSESFCGDNGQQEGPVLSLLESDDDLRCIVEEYEAMQLEGKFRSRVWIFVCNANDGFDHNAFIDKYAAVNVIGDWFYGTNNGFVEPIGLGLDGDNKRNGENLFVRFNKYENKSKKLGDDSLRKTVLKQQLLANGIRSFCGTKEQSDMEFASENGISQSPPKQLCPEHVSPLSSESKNLNFGADPFRMNVLDGKRTNGSITNIESPGEILPLAESNSGPLNSKDGNSHTRRKGPNGSSLLGQSRIISGNQSGLLITNQFVATERSGRMSLNSSINWRVNGFDPNCEIGNINLESLKRTYGENIVPKSWGCNMMERGLVPPTCHYPLGSGAYPMKSLQSTQSQKRAYGGCICNPYLLGSGAFLIESLQGIGNQHRVYGGCIRMASLQSTGSQQKAYAGCIRDHISKARNRRACPYHINSRRNVSELGTYQNFRLDGKTWIGRFYSRLRSSSNISNQGPPAIRGKQGTIDDDHILNPPYFGEEKQIKEGAIDDQILNPPYCGEEKLLKPVGHIAPQKETAKLDIGQVARFGNGESILLNSLLSARAADVDLDLLTSSDFEKIDDANQTLSENSRDKVGMGGQTPLNCVEEPHSMNQSICLHSPCKSSVNKFLVVESGLETLDIQKGGAKELKYNGASDVYLNNHSLESDGEGQLPVWDAREHISETSLKAQPNGLGLMDEQGSSEQPNGISSVSSSCNVSKCDDDVDKREAVQHSRKSNSSSAEKDKNKKTSSCLKKGNDGIPADIIALCAHLATKELQIIKEADLEFIKELGHGTYGTVYHGKWKGSDVAIKRIKPSCFSNGAKNEDRLVADFWKEAHTLGQLHHPNIVALYGVVTDGPVNCLATLTEYMVNGSLTHVLRKKDRTIDRRKRTMIAMDASFGMEYLHEKNIVHFDLKSHNFLVNMRDPQRPVCKIGDLGLSKIKQRTLVSGGIRGTIPWMAPELLSGRNLVSEKVDVFSFGMVMWELLTCEEPYANMRSEEIIGGIIRDNLRPEIPNWCDPSWRSLMERCWSSNPDCRPSFSEIVKELRSMAASMNIK